MIKSNAVSFVNNLARLASSSASGTGKSVMAVEAYDKKNYLRDFAGRYGVPAESLSFVVSGESLDDTLTRWLCGPGEARSRDRRLARQFCWLLRRLVGEPKSVQVLGEDRSVLALLSKTEGDDAPHYVVEDLLFAAYPEGTLCFLLGRGE